MPCARFLTIACFILLGAPGAQAASVILFDDFGGTSGSPSSGVGFLATAVFPSNEDGIRYSSGLYPSTGSMEVRLRVDVVGAKNPATPGGVSPFSAILDSRGAGGRQPGDIFVFVEDDGLVRFTYNEGVENPRANPVHQIVSTTSILDDSFHTVGISYGIGGMTLAIDDVIEATNPFAVPATPRVFSLGDYHTSSSFGFGFEGEVDWIRVTIPMGVPEAGTAALLSVATALIFARPARKRL